MNAASPVETLVTDHLDLWTAALKRKSSAGRGSSSKVELYGIKKLRELILDLAVRGLLVPQDPNDEPASELLKKIAAEKAKLVKEGKIKKEKPLPGIGDEEKPFDLPSGWAWERLGGVGTVASSSRVHQKDWQSSGVPFFRTREIVVLSQHGFVNNDLFISEELYQSFARNGLAPAAGDLMFTGVGTIGVPYVVTESDRFYFKDASVLIFKNHFGLLPRFLFYFMRSPCWINAIHEGSMGTTVHTLTIVRANNVLIPLPPLAEQHRVVAKVDELIALCDQLEQQTDAGLSAHQTLVETLLSALTSATDHAQFASAWQRIAGHFDTLFTTEESIDQLKQTVLQLAVMGKLVPQDPNDEPASELLKKIAARPRRHTLPGWVTVSLGQLGDILGGATPSKSNTEYWTGNIPWVSPKDMKRNLITDAEDHVSEEAISNSSLKKIPSGSLLMVVRGMILAHSFPVAITECEVTINQDMKALVIPPELGAYLLTYMQAMKQAFVALVDRSSHGTCKLVSEKLWSYPVSLPPQAEQQRIVAKVGELMALCDQLKSRLSDAQTTQLHLADALVEQAIC